MYNIEQIARSQLSAVGLKSLFRITTLLSSDDNIETDVNIFAAPQYQHTIKHQHSKI